MYTTSCKWSGMQTITNLVDLRKKMLKIELLDHQNLSSKFIFPHESSARRLDYLGNCGVRTNIGVGLLHTYRCHRCTAQNASFVVIRAFRFVGQHYCGLVFMLASSAAARHAIIDYVNNTADAADRAIMNVGTSWLHFRDCRRFGR